MTTGRFQIGTVLLAGVLLLPLAEASGNATQAAILDVFPESVVQLPGAEQGKAVQSSRYTPSGSLWGRGLDERVVFHREIKHEQDAHNSFGLRIGKGGQLYSLRGAFGESIPPQGAGNPWNDEVWQFVAVCGKYNGAPNEVNEALKRYGYSSTLFIHNSGAYMGTRIDSGTITLSCDVRLDGEQPGALDIILRDTSRNPWKTFATLSVAEEGIAFNSKRIVAAEAGVWYSVALSFGLGEDSDGQVDVTVKPVGGEATAVKMPFAEEGVTAFNWLGLSASDNTHGVLNIDNLAVKRVEESKTTWPVRADFEDYGAGQTFAYVVGRDEAKGGDAFVSDRVALSGRNSLEIHDAPGLPGGWPPMVRLAVRSMELKSFYCPLLGADAPQGGRTYRTVNWGMVPQLRTIHRSPILYYVQTRDVGDGIIEITYVVHNFSARDDVVFDWLNAPWGGTRITSLPYHYVSSADGDLWDRRKSVELELVNGIDVRKTGGWNLSCATEADDSPSLALVFGRDRHLDAELERAGKGLPHCQIASSIYRDMIGPLPEDLRTRPEHTWRNYDPAVVIPRLDLVPGASVWYRSFLVVNRKDRAIELAQSLVDKVDYGSVIFDPETTPKVPVYVRGGRVVDGQGARPAFRLFSRPVPGTMPLFLVENAETGREVITTDPYIFVPQEKLDLDISPEDPRHDFYSQAVGYSMDKNNTRWKRLLGYACVEKPADESFQPLSTLLDSEMFPAADTYHVDLWVKTEQGVAP